MVGGWYRFIASEASNHSLRAEALKAGTNTAKLSGAKRKTGGPRGPVKLPLCLCENSTFERPKMAISLSIYSTFESVSDKFCDIPIRL